MKNAAFERKALTLSLMLEEASLLLHKSVQPSAHKHVYFSSKVAQEYFTTPKAH